MKMYWYSLSKHRILIPAIFLETAIPPLFYCVTHFILKLIAKKAFEKIRSSCISSCDCQQPYHHLRLIF